MAWFYFNQPDVIAKLNLLAGGIYIRSVENGASFNGVVGTEHIIMVNAAQITLPASPVWGVDSIALESGVDTVVSVTLIANGNNINSVAGNKVLAGTPVAMNVKLVAVNPTVGWRIVSTPAALTPVVGVGGAGPGIERAIRRGRLFMSN